ncbi:MAG: pentapeptide repeat-containing protein [Xenococcaceae cyanobacterium MO_234.B1]|nr:pentapeptide repeat-containing protein [Xenococcaceae cyanobacterium MO_234.B1]
MSRDALVVGINNYQDGKLDNLKAPALDAEAIAQILEKYGEFNVWRLPEAIDPNTKNPYVAKTEELSLTQLQKALVKLFKPEGRQAPDTALFYFSGHGLRQDLGIQEGFLASSDVDTNLSFNGLSLQWLRRLLQESPIRQQIIWLDCCHSGEILNFNKYDPGEQGQARDRCFIAASREFESAYQALDSNYSVLTKVLLDGLDPNRSPQQWITTISLTDFINENLRNENQRPVFTNFGSPINLTRTLDTPIPVSKGQDSDDICPYKGLEYFDCNDEDPKYFYGREKLTDKLIDRVRQNNFLAILGASGSGKSSVLRAGLLHQLKLGRKLAGSQDWKIQIMLPGQHPLQNLALSWLEPNLSDTERAKQLDDIESLLQKEGEGLRKLVQASTSNRIILVIDQFEEAFTLCPDLKKREAFFQCLLEALDQTDNKLCLIIAMRGDFFGKCIEREYSGLSQIIQANLITIPPMKAEELRQAIASPADKVKLTLEPGLAETILKDVEGSPGSLPLLQDTLRELWYRRENNQLKFTAYSKLGGIGGTLNQRATKVYKSLTPQEQDCAKHIFLSLTTLGEGTEDTRRRVLKQDLITAKHSEKLIDNVVQKLADEKLIVTRNQVESNSQIGQQAEIDVAHEALIRNWILLRQWLDECRDKLRQKRKIEDSAKDWQTSVQKTDYLLSKKRLKEAKDFQKEQQEKYPLSQLASSFVTKSSKYQRRERIKFFGLFLIIPLIGTIIGGYFVVRELLLNADKRIVQDCTGKKDCPGRIQALERLVKAKKNLKFYNLKNANLKEADLRNARLHKANFENANLYKANLENANLENTYFINANLNNANLNNANLNNARLYGAHLKEADLENANLENADFRDTNLKNANFNRANVRKANIIPKFRMTNSQIKSSCNWKQAYYAGEWTSDKGFVPNWNKNQAFIKKIKNDEDYNSEKTPDCSKWEQENDVVEDPSKKVSSPPKNPTTQIIEVSETNFQEEVLDSNLPVLVKFSDLECGSCRKMIPVMEKIAEKYAGQVKVVTLNTQKNINVTSQYGIRGIPTIIIFKRGQNVDVDMVQGYVSEQTLAETLEQYLN